MHKRLILALLVFIAGLQVAALVALARGNAHRVMVAPGYGPAPR